VNMEPLNHFLLHVWGLQSWSLMAVQWAGNEIFAVYQLSSFSKLRVSARPKFVSFICRCRVQSKDVNIHHVKGELKVEFYLARTFEAWLMDPTCWNLPNYFTTSLWSHSYVPGDYSQIQLNCSILDKHWCQNMKIKMLNNGSISSMKWMDDQES
jgi:hypothetical protein